MGESRLSEKEIMGLFDKVLSRLGMRCWQAAIMVGVRW